MPATPAAARRGRGSRRCGAAPISIVPPTSAARSRMPTMPWPPPASGSGAPPPPSSVTSIATRVRGVADGDLGAGRVRVAQRVRERLLDDAVGGEVDAGRQRDGRALALDDDLEPRGLDGGGERVEVVEARLRGVPVLAVLGLVGAHGLQQAAQLGERVAAGGLDRLQGLAGDVGALVEHVLGRDGLDDDDRDVVGDDVVQLAGDPRPLPRDRAARGVPAAARGGVRHSSPHVQARTAPPAAIRTLAASPPVAASSGTSTSIAPRPHSETRGGRTHENALSGDVRDAEEAERSGRAARARRRSDRDRHREPRGGSASTAACRPGRRRARRRRPSRPVASGPTEVRRIAGTSAPTMTSDDHGEGGRRGCGSGGGARPRLWPRPVDGPHRPRDGTVRRASALGRRWESGESRDERSSATRAGTRSAGPGRTRPATYRCPLCGRHLPGAQRAHARGAGGRRLAAAACAHEVRDARPQGGAAAAARGGRAAAAGDLRAGRGVGARPGRLRRGRPRRCRCGAPLRRRRWARASAHCARSRVRSGVRDRSSDGVAQRAQVAGRPAPRAPPPRACRPADAVASRTLGVR